MKFRVYNSWQDCTEFTDVVILGVGRTDDQFYLVLFNFSFILEI